MRPGGSFVLQHNLTSHVDTVRDTSSWFSFGPWLLTFQTLFRYPGLRKVLFVQLPHSHSWYFPASFSSSQLRPFDIILFIHLLLFIISKMNTVSEIRMDLTVQSVSWRPWHSQVVCAWHKPEEAQPPSLTLPSAANTCNWYRPEQCQYIGRSWFGLRALL